MKTKVGSLKRPYLWVCLVEGIFIAFLLTQPISSAIGAADRLMSRPYMRTVIYAIPTPPPSEPGHATGYPQSGVDAYAFFGGN